MTRQRFPTQFTAPKDATLSEKQLFDIVSKLADDVKNLMNNGVSILDNLYGEVQSIVVNSGEDTIVTSGKVRTIAGAVLIDFNGTVTSSKVTVVNNRVQINCVCSPTQTTAKLLILGE